MIRYTAIKNEVPVSSWLSDFADGSYYEPCFGKPERWVRAGDEGDSQVLDTREIDDGIESHMEYKLAAEYSVSSEDVTSAMAQQQALANGMRAQEVGAQVIAMVWAVNESKNLSPEGFQSLLADSSLQLIERLLWSGSLKTAKALIQTSPSIQNSFSSEEVASVLALIDSSGLVP